VSNKVSAIRIIYIIYCRTIVVHADGGENRERATHFNRQIRDHQRRDVAEHMKTVGDEGHRVSYVADYDLHQEEKRRQPKHRDETAFLTTVSTHRVLKI